MTAPQECWHPLSDEAHKDGRWLLMLHQSGTIHIGWWCHEDNEFWSVVTKTAQTGDHIDGIVAWVNYPRDLKQSAEGEK